MTFTEIRAIVGQTVGSEPSEWMDHRCRLAEFWQIPDGAHVLEVGCGRGFTTTVLATAVGSQGKVIAIDTQPLEKGSWHQWSSKLLNSVVGSRVQYCFGTDLLEPSVTFEDGSFELAVFSHSPFFLTSPQVLAALFRRVRPWSKRLAYAEYDLQPRDLAQTPHMLDFLTQAYLILLAPEESKGSVHSLLLPSEARQMAEQGGWHVAQDLLLQGPGGGSSWQEHITELSREMLESRRDVLSPDALSLAETCLILVEQLASEVGVQSMSTYSFIAE